MECVDRPESGTINRDSQSGSRPSRQAAAADTGATQTGALPAQTKYTASLPQPGIWSRENSKCWLAAMSTYLEAYGCWQAVTGEVQDDQRAALAATLIKLYLPKDGALHASGISDGSLLWKIINDLSTTPCYGESARLRSRFIEFTLRDAVSAFEYVIGKEIRLLAYKEVGGAISDIEVYEELVRGVEVVDPHAGYVIRCLSKGSIQIAKECIKIHPGCSKTYLSIAEAMVADHQLPEPATDINRRIAVADIYHTVEVSSKNTPLKVEKVKSLGKRVASNKRVSIDTPSACPPPGLTKYADYRRDGLTLTRPGMCILMNVCGPFPNPSREGFYYVSVIVDLCSSYTHVWGLRSKCTDEALRHLRQYLTSQRRTDRSQTMTLYTNSDKCFRTDAFYDFCDNNGIHLAATEQSLLSQNEDIISPKLRTVEDIQSLVSQAGLPQCCFVEAAICTAYFFNRQAMGIRGGKSPCEIHYGKRPRVYHLHPLGTLCAVMHIVSGSVNEQVALSGTVVGYGAEIGEYRILVDSTGEIIKSKNAIFGNIKDYAQAMMTLDHDSNNESNDKLTQHVLNLSASKLSYHSLSEINRCNTDADHHSVGQVIEKQIKAIPTHTLNGELVLKQKPLPSAVQKCGESGGAVLKQNSLSTTVQKCRENGGAVLQQNPLPPSAIKGGKNGGAIREQQMPFSTAHNCGENVGAALKHNLPSSTAHKCGDIGGAVLQQNPKYPVALKYGENGGAESLPHFPTIPTTTHGMTGKPTCVENHASDAEESEASSVECNHCMDFSIRELAYSDLIYEYDWPITGKKKVASRSKYSTKRHGRKSRSDLLKSRIDQVSHKPVTEKNTEMPCTASGISASHDRHHDGDSDSVGCPNTGSGPLPALDISN